MKKLFLFVAIFMLLGVMKKPEPIQPCSDTIYCHFYVKGKKVGVTKRRTQSAFAPIEQKINDMSTGKTFYADSMVVKLIP